MSVYPYYLERRSSGAQAIPPFVSPEWYIGCEVQAIQTCYDHLSRLSLAALTAFAIDLAPDLVSYHYGAYNLFLTGIANTLLTSVLNSRTMATHLNSGTVRHLSNRYLLRTL